MDNNNNNNNWRPQPPLQGGGGGGGEAPAEDGVNWRDHFSPGSRDKIVNKIVETLQKRLPVCDQGGLHELKKIALRFEEKTYHSASNQSDYLKKISLKMIAMETKSQNAISNAVAPNSNVSINKPSDTDMQPQMSNPGQQLPNQLAVNQSQPRQQLLVQDMQNHAPSGGGQVSGSLSSTLLSVSGLNQSPLPTVVRQSTNMGVSQNSMGNAMGQGLSSNLLINPSRQIQARQSSAAQSMLQHQVMRSNHRPQKQPQATHQTAISQQPMITSQPQQHHQLTSQLPMQQSQLNGQQNPMGDLQQQPQQQLQSRLLNQQSNLPNLQQQQLLSHQNNLSNVHQQPLAPQSNISGLHEQQQLLGTQLGNGSLQVGQHAVHLLQQSKSQAQQQMQIGGTNLLSQGQQLQPMAVQQHLMSQMQQPPAQLQTQAGLQQTVGLPQQANLLQRDVQQRLQAPNSLLQQQNATSSTLVDTTSQAGNANAGDWQEETYQKLQVMKQSYLPNLTEMLEKIVLTLQQKDTLPQQPKSEQLDKMKRYKTVLEHMIAYLQVSKSDISITFKEKMGSYEKQILGILNAHRPRKPASLQPGQLRPHHIQSVQPHQSLPQITQMQSHENRINPQLPQMNIQGSVVPMQNNGANLHHGSLSSTSGVSSAQQNMMNSLQTNTSIESGLGNAVGSLTQAAVGSMPQNSVNIPQQVNKGMMSHQSGVSMAQSSVNGLQPNSNMIQHQHLKQLQEQRMIQTQQLNHQMQQQQLLHKQQQLQQQAKHLQQQQQLPAQLMAHQMAPLHQMSDGNDIKMKPGMGVKQGVFPPANQSMNYAHQQLKPGASFPSSSPQLLQAASPQIPPHSSPQIDQQNMLSSLTRAGTPMQSANSPAVVPSPSTALAPSPMSGDLEKPISAVSSLLSVGNVGHQATFAPSHVVAPSLAIGTPGISASPLLAEFSCLDGAHGNATPAVSGKSTVTEQPIERLMTAVKALSPQALSAAVNDIGSVVSMVDRIAGSAPGNGSRAAVGEELVAVTKCRLQAKNFTIQDGAAGSRKMKRLTSVMPLSVASSTGSVEDDFLHFIGMESCDLESTATSAIKRPRTEANHVILEEIRYINQRLIDTVVDISAEEVDPGATAAAVEGREGVIVKCSYIAVSLSPDFKTHYESAQMSRIQPLCLLVPANYPNCSPLLLDKLPVEVSKEYEDLSAKTKSRFSISLRNLSQPMSLREIASTWDKCARGVILEYAQQLGGGSFSSKYGTWEGRLTAA